MSDSLYTWLTPESKKFLERDYLIEGQSLDERVTEIANSAAKILGEHIFDAPKFIEYFRKGYYSLSTPIWTNFGTDRGLPISCYGSYSSDDMESILDTNSEIGMMSKHGGGTSWYLGALRERGALIRGGKNGKSSGPVHFAQLPNTTTNVVSQGSARRGHCTVTLPLWHPDIKEFLTIRREGSPIQDLSFGITVSDEWLESMIAGDMDKRDIWAQVIKSRNDIGFPYIMFIDNVNNARPDIYKRMGLLIYASNMCQEISLPSSEFESFVCCLSSMNIVLYHDWKNTDAVRLLLLLLDAVMEEFIQKAGKESKYFEKAVRFAKRHRAVGIGWIGWHSFLQAEMLPFGSAKAREYNIEIAKHIFEEAMSASKHLAEVFGETELLNGEARRNATVAAIAPTKSSSFIIGSGQISEGIEPWLANVFVDDKAKIKVTVKNKYLEEVLEDHNLNVDDVWDSIKMAGGSVQHLTFLTEHERNVFKTFVEIDQNDVIELAADRQKWIDQGQSLNLCIPASTPPKEVNALYLKAWRLGIKNLYYTKNVNSAQKLSREFAECKSCAA